METCTALDIDPWTATTSGSLVLTVDPDGTDAVLSALRERETAVARVGQVADGDGVYVDDDRITHPGTDASWAAYSRLSDT